MKNSLTTLLLIGIITALVLLLYPWYELATAGGLGFVRNNIGWSVIALLMVMLGWHSLSQDGLLICSIPQFWLVGLCGSVLACIPFLFTGFQFVENNFWLPFGLLASWLFLLAMVTSQSFKDNADLVLVLIVVTAFAQALIALWQLFHSYMMEATSGFSSHKFPQVKGTFNQRNLYASFIATALACAFFLYPAKSSLRFYPHVISPELLNRLLLAFISLASFTLILTDSRVGIYASLLCILLFLIAYIQSWKIKLVKPLALVLVGVMAALSVIEFIYDSKTKDFSRTTNRQTIYFTSYEAIKDKPIIGHGLGSFEKAYIEKLSGLIESGKLQYENVKGRPENLSHPHNELLYWGVQGGLVSVIGLLIMAFSVLRLFRRIPLKKVLAFIALLTPITFHLMVELPFYISTVHLIAYLLLIGFVVCSIGEYKTLKIKVKRKRLFKTIISGVGVAIICVLSVNTYSLLKANRFEKALNPDLEDLKQVKLTLGWNDTYQALKLRYEANRAAKLGVVEPQLDYMHWLEKQIHLTPRLNYYFNLYAVNRYLGNSFQAEYYYREIKRLFVGVNEAELWLESIQPERPAN